MTSIGLRRSLVYRTVARMFSNKYEEAVHKLNSLQSNKASIAQIRKDIKTGQKCTNLEDMENYLMRTGVTLNTLDKLSVIHVAGTKGKGSTSAMCESILRAHGYRTGFYSSPHLVAVRERIRLFGLPLSEEAFAKHFHKVYDALYKTQAYDGDMPKYFAFLTVMAFNVFLEEQVDVAVVEVGIGGIVDYTNVVRKAPVIGITALGLDHTAILGTTLPEIASAKAGIMKPGCLAYTVPQTPDAMDVLIRKSNDVQCPLTEVPNYNTYTFQNGLRLSIDLEAYRLNASLSIQLAHAWMRIKTKRKYNTDTDLLINSLSKETVIGLRDCKWPGRYQVIEMEYGCVYLDGAHTKESMEICAKWFEKNCRFQDKILIFSATGDRNAEVLLKPLSRMQFDTVYFVIPIAYKELSDKSDNYSIMEHNDLISRCHTYANIWKNINNQTRSIVVLECVSDVLLCIKDKEKRSILITGSLHLVGAALSVIDPKLSQTMSMHMWMWFGYDVGELLFPGLNINTRWSFALTWIVLFFVSLLFEASKVYLARVQRAAHKKLYPYRSDERRNLLCEREQGNPMEPTTSRNASTGQVSRWYSFRLRTLVNLHQTAIFLVHNVVGYLLMLVVMVYNVQLILAVVLGMMLGYFLFGPKLTMLQMKCFGSKRMVICTPECDDTDRCNTEKCSWEQCEGKLCKQMDALELQQASTPLTPEPYTPS